MDYKSIVTENAWWGVNIDYGLLHMQLGTPIVTGLILTVVLIALNKLLFQPVLRTLDARQSIVNDSTSETQKVKMEISTLSQEYETKLEGIRHQVSELYQSARSDAQVHRDKSLQDAQQIANQELLQGRQNLIKEIEAAQDELEKSTEHFVTLATQKLLS